MKLAAWLLPIALTAGCAGPQQPKETRGCGIVRIAYPQTQQNGVTERMYSEGNLISCNYRSNGNPAIADVQWDGGSFNLYRFGEDISGNPVAVETFPYLPRFERERPPKEVMQMCIDMKRQFENCPSKKPPQ